MSEPIQVPEAEVAEESHPVPDGVYYRANAIVALIVAGVSLFLVFSGLGYGFWDGEKPGPGFFPICVGLALLALALLWLMQSLRRRIVREDDSSLPDRKGHMNIVLSTAIVIAFGLIVQVIGFAIPFAFALGILFRVVARRRWLFTIVTSLVTTIAVALLFRMALGVPLPLSPVPFLAAIGI